MLSRSTFRSLFPIALMVVGLLFAFPLGARTQPPEPEFTGSEYKIEQNSITITWDSSGPNVTYQIKARWTDPDILTEYIVTPTTNTEVVIPRYRSGHFIYMVRGCNDITDPTTCSEWAASDGEDAQGNPYGQVTIKGTLQSGKWRIFWMVPPPSPPVIE